MSMIFQRLKEEEVNLKQIPTRMETIDRIKSIIEEECRNPVLGFNHYEYDSIMHLLERLKTDDFCSPNDETADLICRIVRGKQ